MNLEHQNLQSFVFEGSEIIETKVLTGQSASNTVVNSTPSIDEISEDSLGQNSQKPQKFLKNIALEIEKLAFIYLVEMTHVF